jgi:hypothetical protein
MMLFPRNSLLSGPQVRFFAEKKEGSEGGGNTNPLELFGMI